MPGVLTSLGCTEIALHYLCIDTLRVDRNLLADIFTHWRDGFGEWVSANANRSLEEVRARFDDIIESTRRPDGYAAWLIPSISARVTSQAKSNASMK